MRHKTVANLSDNDPALVDGFRAVLKGGEVINRRTVRVACRRKVGMHFEIVVTNDGIFWSQRADRTAEEARQLDGVCVTRASLDFEISRGPSSESCPRTRSFRLSGGSVSRRRGSL